MRESAHTRNSMFPLSPGVPGRSETVVLEQKLPRDPVFKPIVDNEQHQVLLQWLNAGENSKWRQAADEQLADGGSLEFKAYWALINCARTMSQWKVKTGNSALTGLQQTGESLYRHLSAEGLNIVNGQFVPLQEAVPLV